MLLDQDFTSSTSGLPFTEANYQMIALDDTATGSNLLLNPSGSNLPGWVLELDATEKVVSDTTAISGLLSFTTYVTETVEDTDGPTDPQTGEACFEEEIGTGRIYRLLATNANALVGDDRFLEVDGFASAPFVVPSGFSQQSAVGNDPNPFASQEMQDIRQDLMGLFPTNCRFGNFSMRLSVNVSTGEQIPLAEIPQCVVVKNWKEF
jgi:hypothetical protein